MSSLFKDFFDEVEKNKYNFDNYLSYKDKIYSQHERFKVSNDAFVKIFHIIEYYTNNKKIQNLIDDINQLNENDKNLFQYILSVQLKYVVDKKSFQKIFKYLNQFDHFDGFFNFISEISDNKFYLPYVMDNRYFKNQNKNQQLAIQFIYISDSERLGLNHQIYLQSFLNHLSCHEIDKKYKKYIPKMVDYYLEHQVKMYNKESCKVKQLHIIEKMIYFIENENIKFYIKQEYQNKRGFWENILNEFNDYDNTNFKNPIIKKTHAHLFKLIQCINKNYDAYPKYNFLYPEEINYQFETYYYCRYSNYNWEIKEDLDKYLFNKKSKNEIQLSNFLMDQFNLLKIENFINLDNFNLFNQDIQCFTALYKKNFIMNSLCDEETVWDIKVINENLLKQIQIWEMFYDLVHDKNKIDFKNPEKLMNAMISLNFSGTFSGYNHDYNLLQINKNDFIVLQVKEVFDSINRFMSTHQIFDDLKENVQKYTKELFLKLSQEQKSKLVEWLWEKVEKNKIWSQLIGLEMNSDDNKKKMTKL